MRPWITPSVDQRAGEGQAAAGLDYETGGKSELHRAGCWLTASGGDPKDSATENKPPLVSLAEPRGKGETVR